MFRGIARSAALAAAITLYMLYMLAPVPAQQVQAQGLEQVEITTKNGVRVFDVEMADTEPKRRVGLMHRKELPDGRGMLFDFGRDQPVAMWMQNTYVSLDMIFIREDGTIANIAENTTPLSERSIFSAGPVKSVLEVVAGTAKRYGIAAADKVSHRIFRKR
jgi:uncharacterized membrane protein (UPF0127 family)